MNITEHLDALDRLVLDHTKPPEISEFRKHLTIVREQFEGLQAAHAALKNEHAVLKNVSAQRIAELEEKNLKRDNELLEFNRAVATKVSEVEPAEVRIMKYLFQCGSALNEGEFASHLSLPLPTVRENIRFLIEHGHIRQMDGTPLRYQITQDGKAYMLRLHHR